MNNKSNLPPVGLVLLAAGASERMGQSKQLLLFQGESLLKRSIKTALTAGYEPIMVVLGANEEKIREEIKDLPVNTIFNKSWQDGMGSSIRTGTEQLLLIQPNLDGILMMLCDQPQIDTDFLILFKTTFYEQKKPIVATAYGRNAGVPALFGSTLFEKLMHLDGKEGARNLIASQKHHVSLVFPENMLLDIDTPEDYAKLLQGL